MRRGTPCDGYHVQGSFTFRNENQHAQELSRRSRRELQHGAWLAGSEAALQDIEASAPSELEFNEITLQAQFSWLNEQAFASIPDHVRLDAATQAVDRFFANWIVYPNELSPGYMHHLPLLYETATPDSVLRSSIRALAFADVRRTSSGGQDYKLKALQNYGAAIHRLRAVAGEPTNFQRDETLAALLLIDAFEVCLASCFLKACAD